VRNPVTPVARWLRSFLHSWSQETDRAFHDARFEGAAEHDPFSFAYPGYLTTRRFADLAAPHVQGLASALDVGCGTAEITCELASRFPETAFRGVDHSESAIRRARRNAERRGLRNLEFQVADVTGFEPDAPVGMVLLFDSFHHLTAPSAFVERLGRFTSRFLLIEPRGDWKGTWRKDIDVDWLVLELDKIRAHLAHVAGEEEAPPGGPPGAEPADHGAAVEQRYSLEELEAFFAGYALDVRGTVAGLEAYPPDPRRGGPARERFGRIAYELLTDLDDRLRRSDRDLLAKHWVIHAERGGQAARRRTPGPPHPRDRVPVEGPYDVEYVSYDGPQVVGAGEEFQGVVRLRNRSWQPWSSHDSASPVFLSYHWLDRRRRTLVEDGLRTALPRTLAPAEESGVAVRVRAPESAGRFFLAIDLVHEGVCWFSGAGSPCLTVPVRVTRRR
jgi:SAM-dependent methyltransferase